MDLTELKNIYFFLQYEQDYLLKENKLSRHKITSFCFLYIFFYGYQHLKIIPKNHNSPQNTIKMPQSVIKGPPSNVFFQLQLIS